MLVWPLVLFLLLLLTGLPGSTGLEGLEAIVDLRGGTGALTAAETAALERARAVHALSTGRGSNVSTRRSPAARRRARRWRDGCARPWSATGA